MTKRIQRRNANICKYRERGMTYRAIGRMFKLSHTQVMNILRKEKVEAARTAPTERNGDGNN